jgi:hypothetical protein
MLEILILQRTVEGIAKPLGTIQVYYLLTSLAATSFINTPPYHGDSEFYLPLHCQNFLYHL